jgi:hypothetical protein
MHADPNQLLLVLLLKVCPPLIWRWCAQVLSDAAVLKRQAHEIEELKDRLSASG